MGHVGSLIENFRSEKKIVLSDFAIELDTVIFSAEAWWIYLSYSLQLKEVKLRLSRRYLEVSA